MKLLAVSVLLFAVSGCTALGFGSGTGQVDAHSAFEALCKLEGDWKGEVDEGACIQDGGRFGGSVEQAGEERPVEGSYHVTAGGSVVEATVFRGTPRETVMMFHLDGGKLMLTQYGEAGNWTTLVADLFAPSFPDADEDVSPQSRLEPDGVGIRFFATRAGNCAPSDGEYLHDVLVGIRKDSAVTFWIFYEDGAPTRAVYVELTQKESPQAAAEASPSRPPTPH